VLFYGVPGEEGWPDMAIGHVLLRKPYWVQFYNKRIQIQNQEESVFITRGFRLQIRRVQFHNKRIQTPDRDNSVSITRAFRLQIRRTQFQ
jgi:hypothetical protein